MPLSEVSDLIVDLRSLTQGVGTYEMEFSHLAELNGRAGRHHRGVEESKLSGEIKKGPGFHRGLK